MIPKHSKTFSINNNIREMVFCVTNESSVLVLFQQVASIRHRFGFLENLFRWFFFFDFLLKEFLERLNLKKGDLVLDVGCGIGGGNILMAEVSWIWIEIRCWIKLFSSKKYGSSVIGVDLSTNMVGIAYERLFDMKDKNLKVRQPKIEKEKFRCFSSR